METVRFNKMKKFLMLYSALALCMMSMAIYTMKVSAVSTVPSFIYATYSGSSILIGESIDTTKLTVTAAYADNTTAVVTDYSLSSQVVTAIGANTITVVYLGKTTTFIAIGKSVEGIVATYSGKTVSIGNAVDKREITAYARFSDGTYIKTNDYQILNPDVIAAGVNTIQIALNGKTTTFIVIGVAARQITSLYASYIGDSVMLGTTISRENIFATGTYADGTSEAIVNYTMSDTKLAATGANTITLTYMGKTASVTITGIERTVASITAVYKGSTVAVGESVRLTDITVTALFTDGKKEVVTDFTVPSSEIYYIGSQTKTVHYSGSTADITIIGVAAKEITYDNAAKFTVTNGTDSLTGAIAVPGGVDAGEITATSVTNSVLKRVITRAVRNSKYISFSIDFSGDIEDEFPLQLTITVPGSYNVNGCSLYYTPNKKSVIAAMNTEIVNGKLVCDIFHSGTYILSYSPVE